MVFWGFVRRDPGNLEALGAGCDIHSVGFQMRRTDAIVSRLAVRAGAGDLAFNPRCRVVLLTMLTLVIDSAHQYPDG